MGMPRQKSRRQGLYSAEERLRRDSSKWTMVQGVLAAFQFLVFLVSLILVLRTLATCEGAFVANVSVIFKTLVLFTIMITGSLWEKEVFGQYLFAPAFFWEDFVSFFVIALHTIYLGGLAAQWPPRTLMFIALTAYVTYAVNAVQFILKLRAARLSEQRGVGDASSARASA